MTGTEIRFSRTFEGKTRRKIKIEGYTNRDNDKIGAIEAVWAFIITQ